MLTVGLFFVNFLLALLWAFYMKRMEFLYFLGSFAVLFCLISLLDFALLKLNYATRIFKSFNFFLFIIFSIFLANLRIAYDVITPKFKAKPGVIAIPLDCQTDIEITLLAIIISLTPGTLVLEVTPDKKQLFLHVMYLHDIEKTKITIKRKFEKPLLEILQ